MPELNIERTHTLGLAGARAVALQLAYFAEAMLLAPHLQARSVKHLHNHLGDSSGTVTMLAAELAAKQAKMLEVAVAAIWVRPASQDLIDKRSSGTYQFVISFENPDTCHPDDNRNLRIRMPAFKPFPVVFLNGTDNVAVEKALRKRQHGYIIKNDRGLSQEIGHPAVFYFQHPL